MTDTTDNSEHKNTLSDSRPGLSQELTESRNIENDSLRFFLAWFISRFMLAPVFWFYTRVLNSTKIIGREHMEAVKGKSFLLCPNHTCSFDIWAGWEIGFLGLRSFFSPDTYLCGLGAVERLGSKPVRDFCLTAGVLPVDRTKGTEQYALQDLLRLFREKKKIIGAMIYPEGTRSKTGRLSRNFKSGAGWVQGQTQVPVIPMYHIGYNVPFPSIGRKFTIIIGKPIDLSEFEGKGQNPMSWVKISEKIMDEIRSIEDEYNPATGDDAVSDDGKIETRPHGWLPHLQDFQRPLGFLYSSDNGSGSETDLPSESVKTSLGLLPPSLLKSSSEHIDIQRLHSLIPAQDVSNLGSPAFQEAHDLSASYGVSPFERGVCSEEMVAQLLNKRYLAFLPTDFETVDDIRMKIKTLREGTLKNPGLGYRFHVHNSVYEEERFMVALDEDIRRVYVSHYLRPTKAMVHYRVKGMNKDSQGRIVAPHSLFARVSEASVALHFATPPSMDILNELVAEGRITKEEAELGAKMPVSQDLVVEPEFSKGGVKQDLLSLYPSVKSELRTNRVSRNAPVRVGVCGELATPESVAAVFRMGADFVFTGLVNSLTVESGGSKKRKSVLFKTTSSDITYAPSFEFLDSELPIPVTRFGTMFATRANRMLDIFKRTSTFAELQKSDREFLEGTMFQMSLPQAYENAQNFFTQWWPEQVKTAMTSDKARAALLMKYWLFEASRKTFDGTDGAEMDYQVRADGSIVAFNKWRAGSVFDDERKITVCGLAKNLLEGALVVSRMRSLREMGVDVPADGIFYKPVE